MECMYVCLLHTHTCVHTSILLLLLLLLLLLTSYSLLQK